MSLASAQRNLATKNRELLQKTAKVKLSQAAMEFGGETLGAVAGFVGEQFNVGENVEAWESVEAGREYLGMDKDAIAKPSLRQKWFKKPSDMISGNLKVDDKTDISLGNLQSLGTLAKSENRSLYESIAGEKGLTGAYTTKRKTNLELQGMDASDAYKDQTRREQSPYMGRINEESSSYDTLRKTMPGSFSEAHDAPSSILKRRKGEEAGKESSMPLPDSSPSTDTSSSVGKMGLKSIQSSINEAYGVGGGERLNTQSARANYYNLMSSGTSQETGENYFDALLKRRDLLKSTEKEIG